jgi:hypothetical protein
VLCDKRISTKVKGKIFKVVRPAMTYSAETWAIKKTQEMKMNVAEMKIACGHTRMDKIENKDIRNKTKVTEIHRKIQEKRLRWYGHIQRREEEFVTKRVLKMELEGKRARGRPRRRWMDCVKVATLCVYYYKCKNRAGILGGYRAGVGVGALSFHLSPSLR